MKKSMFVLVLAAACSKAGAGAADTDRPDSLAEADVAVLDQYAAAITKIADGVEAAGGDCKKAAAAITAASAGFDTKKLEQLLKQTRAGDPTLREWADKRYGSTLKSVFARVGPLLSTCKNDADF